MSRVFSFDYDSSYIPTAPLVPIVVVGYDSTKSPVTVTAFIDSGADGTMIPRDILEVVGAEYEDTIQVFGTAGGVRSRDRYTIHIRVASETVYAIHAVAIEAGDEPLLGRDVLNQLVVTLHGPANVTEIQIG